MRSVLRPGGLLVLQNLNYDLRWEKQPRWFAAQGGVLDGDEVLVWRFADYLPAEERIAFNITLFRRQAGAIGNVRCIPRRNARSSTRPARRAGRRRLHADRDSWRDDAACHPV